MLQQRHQKWRIVALGDCEQVNAKFKENKIYDIYQQNLQSKANKEIST